LPIFDCRLSIGPAAKLENRNPGAGGRFSNLDFRVPVSLFQFRVSNFEFRITLFQFPALDKLFQGDNLRQFFARRSNKELRTFLASLKVSAPARDPSPGTVLI
jgi:hypothetical protein